MFHVLLAILFPTRLLANYVCGQYWQNSQNKSSLIGHCKMHYVPLSQVLEMFHGGRREDMPPHIFAVAQQAYHSLITDHRDQSLVLMGLSGAGKSFNARHLLRYLATAGGSTVDVHTTCKGQQGTFMYLCTRTR